MGASRNGQKTIVNGHTFTPNAAAYKPLLYIPRRRYCAIYIAIDATILESKFRK